ncbi:hypothetical protein BGZ83_010545 [Gryganskiella cystojenkinii]|nr:hypothetical protein BGZ83_010545 [Gryganskiella cystojenkinii]
MTKKARQIRRAAQLITPAPVVPAAPPAAPSPPFAPPPILTTASATASPTGSILLPPVEIEVSPTHSHHSSSSSIRRARARGRRVSYASDDEEDNELDDRYDVDRVEEEAKEDVDHRDGNHRHYDRRHQYDRHHDYHPHTSAAAASSSQRKNRGVWSKQKVHPATSPGAIKDMDSLDPQQSHHPINTPDGGGGGGGSGSGSGLRKSTSKSSITVKSRGCFGRLRRSPNFILFTVSLALFVDMATYGIIVPIIPFIVSDKVNGGATDTGLLLAMYAIGILLSSPLFGILGDSFVSRRVPMLIGLGGMLVSTLLFMVASNFYVFLAARLLQGVAGGSVWTLGLALITDVFPAHTLGAQMGKALVGYTLGMMLGPPLGGFLYERGGYRAPFIFVCVITLIDFFCRALIIEEREEIVKALKKQGKEEEANEEQAEVVALRKKERQDESTSFWRLLQNKRLLGCIIVTACNAFVFSGAEPTVPLHLAATFELTSERIGLVFMAFSLPTLTAPITGALSDRFGAKIICLISLIICGTCTALLGFAQNSLTMIILLFTFIGITGTSILTPVLGELSAVVRVTGQGDGFARAYAIFNMAFSFGVLVGPVVCGLVYENFGFKMTCFVMSGMLFLGIPVTVLWIGGLAQKKRDLAKYKEDEERRWGPGGRRPMMSRSKYSLEFTERDIADAEMGIHDASPPGFDTVVVEKNLEDDLADELGKEHGESEQLGGVHRDSILKSARMDDEESS